jgi:glycosyltransferase involved in cell wall biosynthesis
MKHDTRADRSNAGFLRVAALVDLERRPEAGGHVKSWERIAEAAARARPELDLTVHFEGDAERSEALAPNVRLVMHRPVFSTRRLAALGVIADHTDLAPFHPRLARALAGADVIHTTDAYFAFARTARRLAPRRGAALTTSIHTDTPGYTRVYAERVMRRALGDGAIARLAVDRLRLPERLAASMRSKLARYARACDGVLVGSLEQLGPVAEDLGDRVRILRRGIDTTVFSPQHRNRARLADAYGVAPETFVLLFVGRVDVGKLAMTFAAAVRGLIERGLPVHAVVAGAGNQAGAVRDMLGPRVSLPGVLSQADLALAYASSDLLVFPSRNEIAPNTVLEAKACGLPVVVAPEGGGIFVREPGVDGIVVADPDPAAWADALAALLADPARRRLLAAAGLADIARHHPSWDRVLSDDLLPVWQSARRRILEAQGACSPLAFSS